MKLGLIGLATISLLTVVTTAGAQQRNDVQEWQINGGRYTDVDTSQVIYNDYGMRRHRAHRVVRYRRHWYR